MKQRAGNNHPNVPTLDEMKNGFLGAIRSSAEKRGLLDCKIEKALIYCDGSARHDFTLLERMINITDGRRCWARSVSSDGDERAQGDQE